MKVFRITLMKNSSSAHINADSARRRRLRYLLSTAALVFMAPTWAMADEYNVNPQRQVDLLFELTNNFSTPVIDPNIDALRFENKTQFIFNFDSTRGDQWDFEKEFYENNRAYQTITIQNTSPNDVFTFAALYPRGDGGNLTADVGVKSLLLKDTTLSFEFRCYKSPDGLDTCGNPGGQGYIENFFIGGTSNGLLRLDNAHLDFRKSPDTDMRFTNDARIDVLGTDNVINAPGERIQQAPAKVLELRLNAGSQLDLVNTTNIIAPYNGFLTMLEGSTLNIDDSSLQLTNYATNSSVQTNIIKSTVNINGSDRSLHLTEPFISDSTINLGANTDFYAYRRSVNKYEQSGVYFGGDNTINLGGGARLLGKAEAGDFRLVSFNVNDGKTVINGTDLTSQVWTDALSLNNATLVLNDVNIAQDLRIIKARAGSALVWGKGNAQAEDVQGITLDNSTLSGGIFSESAVLIGQFKDATLRVDDPDQPSGMTFFLNGFDFGPKARITFEGDNKIISRIDPSGVILDPAFPTLKTYSDAFYFERNLPFTDDTFTVNGLGNVTVELNPFATGRTAQDYATGGMNQDGIYDVLFFNFDNTATTPATADSDVVAVSLGGAIPALLTATQVATPSADNKVSYKLELQPLTTLLTHPAVKPTHTLGATATSTVSGSQTITTVTTLLPAQTSNTSSTGTATSTVDPVTGNTITTTVKVAPNQNVAGSALQTVTTTVTSPSGAVLSNTSQTTALKVPTATGTANQVVTSLVTPNTGGNTTSSSTSIIQSPATGSTNKGAAANLLVNSGNNGNTSTLNALNTLTNSQIAPHLESVHAEPYSSYMTVSLEHTDMVMNTVLNQAAPGGMFSTGRTAETTLPETHRRTWLDISYSEGDIEGDGDLGDFDYTLTGLTIGQDLVASGDRTLGAYFSFGTQKMDEHDKAIQDFDGDIYHLGLYLNEVDVGGWDLRGLLGYAYGDHDSTRTVVLSNSIATPSAGFDSHSFYAGIQGTIVGYQNDWVTLSPELGLSYIYYKQESLTESGDPNLSLKVDSADAQSIIASIGVNARFASFSEKVPVYPLAFLRYEHDFYANRNNEHEIDAALVAHPDYKQTFVGQNRGENSIIAGLGLGSDISSNLQVQGGFVIAEHTHGSEWGAGINFRYSW